MTAGEKLSAGAALAIRLQQAQAEAHALGLHISGHALNRAMNAIGWELTGNLEEAAKASRRD